MAMFLPVAGLAILFLETLVGMAANGFIVLINCLDWSRTRKLSQTDLILLCLGSSRLLWHTVVMLHVTLSFLFFHTYLILSIMWFFIDIVNLWFASCLGVWYLTKIAIFSHPVFLQVKQRFSGMVPWLLLSSVFFSFLKTIIFFSEAPNSVGVCDPCKLILNNTGNSDIKKSPACIDLAILVFVPNVIAIVIFLSSTILLIISLWKHTRHLQHNGIGVRDLNTNVHLNAIKALASFIILYVCSFLPSHLYTMLARKTNFCSWAPVLFINVSAAYPSGHAVILILINPKLKQGCVRMIHYLKCRTSEAPS